MKEPISIKRLLKAFILSSALLTILLIVFVKYILFGGAEIQQPVIWYLIIFCSVWGGILFAHQNYYEQKGEYFRPKIDKFAEAIESATSSNELRELRIELLEYVNKSVFTRNVVVQHLVEVIDARIKYEFKGQ